jgi:hypothetical protein
MRLTNHEELRARRQAGLVPADAARVATTPAPASTDAAGPSAPRRRRRSGQHSLQARLERRHAACVVSQRDALTSETTAAPVGGARSQDHASPSACAVPRRRTSPPPRQCSDAQGPPWPPCPGLQGPQRLRGDESSQGSVDELPPATSHGYAVWDFSGVPDPVMFWRFLDATDYWFGYSDDSSAGSYDPARECCVVIANDLANAADAAEVGDGEVLIGLRTGPRVAAGPSAPPLHRQGGRHQRIAGPSTRGRGQASRRVPHGAVAPCLHHERSLRARRTRV